MNVESATNKREKTGTGYLSIWSNMLLSPVIKGQVGSGNAVDQWFEANRKMVLAGRRFSEEMVRFCTARMMACNVTLENMSRCDDYRDATVLSNQHVSEAFKAYTDEAAILMTMARKEADGR